MRHLDFASAYDLAGRSAIVTGAAGGIGREIASVFAERGIRLALVDRDPSVEDVARELGGGDGVQAYVADLASEDDIRRTVASVAERFGGIDILVNNAGIGIVGAAESFGTADWDRTMAINLRGQFLFAREAAPHMLRAGWGRVIIMASQASVIGIDEHVAYSTSKTGLLGMSRCMAIEWGPRGVTVNTISPTVVETPMAMVGWSGEKGERAKAEIPTRRFVLPAEVALTVLFLASHAAGMINGANICIDGGFTIR